MDQQGTGLIDVSAYDVSFKIKGTDLRKQFTGKDHKRPRREYKDEPLPPDYPTKELRLCESCRLSQSATRLVKVLEGRSSGYKESKREHEDSTVARRGDLEEELRERMRTKAGWECIKRNIDDGLFPRLLERVTKAKADNDMPRFWLK